MPARQAAAAVAVERWIKTEISVVIPVYNEQANLQDLLDSLVAIPGTEVIVVDGGSSDMTREIIALFPQIKFQFSAKGRAGQMNQGALAAAGRVLFFLHADSTLPADWVTAVAGISDHSWGFFRTRLSGERRIFRIIETLMDIRSCATAIATGDKGIFVARELFAAIGGFPPLPLMEDIEISKKLKKKAKPVCVDKKITTSSRRWENKGIARTILLMWKIRLLYFFGMDADQLGKMYER